MQLIPLGNGETRSTAPFTPIASGLYSGLHIVVQANALKDILDHIEAWYENRDEVILIDHGYSAKQFHGFIILEWIECEPDELLLSIFDHEEAILDYCVYSRSLEVE